MKGAIILVWRSQTEKLSLVILFELTLNNYPKLVDHIEVIILQLMAQFVIQSRVVLRFVFGEYAIRIAETTRASSL